MLLIKVLTGTFLIASLAMGCNAADDEATDAAEQKPLELEDVQDEIGEEEVQDYVPLDPVDLEHDTTVHEPGSGHEAGVEENARPESFNRDQVSEPEAADRAAEPADSDRQPDSRPAVTIPPEVINPDYKALLNDDNELIVSGRTVDELLELVGEPPHILRQGHRGSGWHKEVWVLPIYQEDSTGLYIYIQNGQVSDWRLDTFMGVGNHPQLLEWFR